MTVERHPVRVSRVSVAIAKHSRQLTTVYGDMLLTDSSGYKTRWPHVFEPLASHGTSTLRNKHPHVQRQGTAREGEWGPAIPLEEDMPHSVLAPTSSRFSAPPVSTTLQTKAVKTGTI